MRVPCDSTWLVGSEGLVLAPATDSKIQSRRELESVASFTI